jgi:cbb3-type cytochrome oxidase cytochrome c subunit
MKRIIATMAITLCAVVLTGRASADESDKAPQGKGIFTKYKCQGCHSVEAADIKRTGKPSTAKHKPPDLSKVGDTRGHEWIEGWLDKTEKIETRVHPAVKFRGTKDEKEAVAAWLETMKTPGGAGAAGAAEQAKDAAKEAKQDAKAADEAAEKAKAAAEEAKEKADTTHAH